MKTPNKQPITSARKSYTLPLLRNAGIFCSNSVAPPYAVDSRNDSHSNLFPNDFSSWQYFSLYPKGIRNASDPNIIRWTILSGLSHCQNDLTVGKQGPGIVVSINIMTPQTRPGQVFLVMRIKD